MPKNTYFTQKYTYWSKYLFLEDLPQKPCLLAYFFFIYFRVVLFDKKYQMTGKISKCVRLCTVVSSIKGIFFDSWHPVDESFEYLNHLNALLRTALVSFIMKTWKIYYKTLHPTFTLYIAGEDHQVVLAPVGYDGPILVQGGDTRDRVSASVMGNAAGTWTDVRLVFKGVRHRDGQLEDLPSDGLTGRWKTCATERGFVTREVFLLILQDLVKHLDDKKIKRPFILFMDGYKG